MNAYNAQNTIASTAQKLICHMKYNIYLNLHILFSIHSLHDIN